MSNKWPISLIIMMVLGVTLMSGCASTSTARTTGTAAPTTTTGIVTTTPTVKSTQIATPTGTNAAAAVGDTVKVDYTGKLTDGTVFDSSIGKTPLEFTIGSGQVIKGFELAVSGMSVGQSKTVVIPPEDAYGDHLDSLVVTVDRSKMGSVVNPTVGQHLTATHSDGTASAVIITAVTDTTVTLDYNHPMAGKTLTFDITLVSITPKK